MSSGRGHRAALALAIACGATVAIASNPPALAAGPLHIEASGFLDARGHARARIYRPGDRVTGTPWRQEPAPIRDGVARWTIADLPYGAYAVVVLHDRNDNGEVDHNLFGLPTEALGFSNGFTLGLFSGMPTYEKLRVVHQADGPPVVIAMH